MLEAAAQALQIIVTPLNLVLLVAAVVGGLILGFVPGLSGITGMTILLPFVFYLPPEQALILLIGISAVTQTSDSIPAILFGVPGTVGSQATVMDGFPMAKNGEASRAFGAAFSSSLLGGLVGAGLLFAAVPILRPLVLSMGSPELFMVSLLGISTVGSLVGSAPLIGIALGLFGIVISKIGMDPQTASFLWTFGQPYLLDGVSVVAAILGLFSVPDLLEVLLYRSTIASVRQTEKDLGRGVLQGVRDTLQNWFLVLRSAVLGVYVGFVPGLGANVVDWLAYGHAKQSVRDSEKIGRGDVRGVIAVEAAGNAHVGGALIPTVAFGVPGSVAMAILLGAFMVLGIRPGLSMIADNLHLTLTMVWSLALANVVGAGICLLLARKFAKIGNVKLHLLFPFILSAVVIAAIQATIHVGDLVVLTVFGFIGWFLKKVDWSRPALAIGLVLGPITSKYLFLSVQAYGMAMFARPGVLVIGALLVLMVWYAIAVERRAPSRRVAP